MIKIDASRLHGSIYYNDLLLLEVDMTMLIQEFIALCYKLLVRASARKVTNPKYDINLRAFSD